MYRKKQLTCIDFICRSILIYNQKMMIKIVIAAILLNHMKCCQLKYEKGEKDGEGGFVLIFSKSIEINGKSKTEDTNKLLKCEGDPFLSNSVDTNYYYVEFHKFKCGQQYLIEKKR